MPVKAAGDEPCALLACGGQEFESP